MGIPVNFSGGMAATAETDSVGGSGLASVKMFTDLARNGFSTAISAPGFVCGRLIRGGGNA